MQCIESVMDFLSGKQKKILDYLEGKMREAAEKMDYEEAASYRDYISVSYTHLDVYKRQIIYSRTSLADLYFSV